MGKDANVVLWSGDPLDVMSRAERAFIDGREIYRYDYSRREGVFAELSTYCIRPKRQRGAAEPRVSSGRPVRRKRLRVRRLWTMSAGARSGEPAS